MDLYFFQKMMGNTSKKNEKWKRYGIGRLPNASKWQSCKTYARPWGWRLLSLRIQWRIWYSRQWTFSYYFFFFLNIQLSIVIYVTRPQSLKITIHLLYRAYDGSKLAASYRRQLPNTRVKGSSASTSPLLDQTHRSSLSFLKVCSGMQT